jgi:hypothetical protein
MVKAHDTVPRMNSGHHGGKKITGRGRHVAVDTEGWPLALVVTAASVSDKGGAKILLIRLFDAVAAVTVEVVARTSPHSFRVPRRRWGRRAHLRLADALPPPGPLRQRPAPIQRWGGERPRPPSYRL